MMPPLFPWKRVQNNFKPKINDSINERYRVYATLFKNFIQYMSIKVYAKKGMHLSDSGGALHILPRHITAYKNGMHVYISIKQ